uniref:Activin_recp domain-containing protein n=1 Tax=Elaeophora elaphi TaxID=1147741 RepID=A0A0R3S2Q9_9BILA
MRHNSLPTSIYIFLILILVIILRVQQLQSLRCKCNANRGPSLCIGDFCDIHNRDGKRAACGALRRARQTIFACVLIRQSSNDTYCHVIGSTTACWCRQMDFCNADLEAELFDVDESSDASDESSAANFISNQRRDEFITESNKQLATTKLSPTQSYNRATVTTAKLTSPASKKQSVQTRINSAVRIDVAEKIKLTPQRENPPTVMTEIISDSYDYILDEE